jgi:hypothetical protein
MLAVRFAITVKVKEEYFIGSLVNLLNVGAVGKLTANGLQIGKAERSGVLLICC